MTGYESIGLDEILKSAGKIRLTPFSASGNPFPQDYPKMNGFPTKTGLGDCSTLGPSSPLRSYKVWSVMWSPPRFRHNPHPETMRLLGAPQQENQLLQSAGIGATDLASDDHFDPYDWASVKLD